MIIGVPKEVKLQEHRVALLPSAVYQLCKRGHQVVVERAAGAGSGYPDADYESAGAEMTSDHKAVFEKAEMIVKVKEPQESEYPLLHPGQILFTYLHFAASRRHLPQSLLGQAIDYALGQWPTLTVYLEDGRLEIDNNLVENAIRPTAVGKKNWLFVGEAGAGQRGAIIYTLIESCRRRNIDPYTYLRDLLTRLPHMTNRQIPEVTPEAWAKSQRACAKAA